MKKNQSVKHHPKFNLTDLASGQEIQILTTYHCLYVATAISSCLTRADIKSAIITEMPKEGYAKVPHFVICPQMFQILPEIYVAFQMEQTINSRWFTNAYIQTLKNAFAIFDYSLVNIRYLNHNDFNPSTTYYLPIDYQSGYSTNMDLSLATEHDVIFYGDANNERRQAFLTELSKTFRVKVISEVFGKELYQTLATAKVIVNIHYYANALLETTRIYEALALNKLIVSENSSDMDEHIKLDGVVDFVDVDDIQGMIKRVQYWLEHNDERIRRIENNKKILSDLPNMFDHFFYRFLLATDNITFDQFWELAGHRYPLGSDRLCLNLPEYTDRTDWFVNTNKAYAYTLFPGLRHSIPWIGCGLSYKYIMMLAKKHGLPQIEVCEDDVEFAEEFSETWNTLKEHLSSTKEKWNIFSGLLSDLSNDATIFSVTDHGNYKIAVTDKMTGTVFCLYNQNVYDTIINWSEKNLDVDTNTIDRYIEKTDNLKIITTSPFLAGHKKELYSTIWEHKGKNKKDLNTMSDGMIQESIKRLKEKIDSFEFSIATQQLDPYSTSRKKTMIAGFVELNKPETNEVLKNIASYIPFVDHLYVVDKTPRSNKSQIQRELNRLSSNIEYISSYKNKDWEKPLGTIATRALDSGYKMLLTMDQDSRFDGDTARKYFMYALSLLTLKPEVALITLNSSPEPVINTRNEFNYCEVMYSITAGSIFQLDIFKKIGGADERLSLHDIAREYCLRAIRSGYKIYSFHHLFLTHKLGELRNIAYLGIFSKRRMMMHTPARLYFIKRDFLLMYENYAQIFPQEFQRLKKEHKKKIKYQLLCTYDWHKSLFQVIRGYIDYKRRKFG